MPLVLLNLIWWEKVTLISLSPDETMRVLLIERGRPIFGDRNFDLRLQKRGERWMKTITTETDQFLPAGRERIVWSLDSSQFMLLSRDPPYNEPPPSLKKKSSVYFTMSEPILCTDLDVHQLSILNACALQIIFSKSFSRKDRCRAIALRFP